MATAMRTVAAKLKQKFPVAVQRLFASSQATATSTKPCGCSAGGLDNPHLRRLKEHLEHLEKIDKKNRRKDFLGCFVGMGLGGLFFHLGLNQLQSKKG